MKKFERSFVHSCVSIQLEYLGQGGEETFVFAHLKTSFEFPVTEFWPCIWIYLTSYWLSNNMESSEKNVANDNPAMDAVLENIKTH